MEEIIECRNYVLIWMKYVKYGGDYCFCDMWYCLYM